VSNFLLSSSQFTPTELPQLLVIASWKLDREFLASVAAVLDWTLQAPDCTTE